MIRYDESQLSCMLCVQMFHRCQRAVTGLQSRCGHCTEQEERLLRNVVSSLAQSLQELSTSFRHTQSSYLKREYPHTSTRNAVLL